MRKDILAKIRALLEDKRSTGLTIAEQMGVPAGMHVSKFDHNDIEQRESSKTKAELMKLTDLFLEELPLTDGFKGNIRSMVSIFFNVGMMTEMITGIIISPFNELEHMSERECENRAYTTNAMAMADPEVIAELAPAYIAWGQQIMEKYGNDAEIKSWMQYFQFVLDKQPKEPDEGGRHG